MLVRAKSPRHSKYIIKTLCLYISKIQLNHMEYNISHLILHEVESYRLKYLCLILSHKNNSYILSASKKSANFVSQFQLEDLTQFKHFCQQNYRSKFQPIRKLRVLKNFEEFSTISAKISASTARLLRCLPVCSFLLAFFPHSKYISTRKLLYHEGMGTILEIISQTQRF